MAYYILGSLVARAIGSISDVADLSSATDSNTSGVSFRPDFDTTEDSDSGEASNSTELTTLEPTYLPNNRSRPLTRLNRSIRHLADASTLPDFSDNPNNDIDEDIISALRPNQSSGSTNRKALGQNDLVEALREVTPNNVYRFFNYYIKLKYGEGGRYLKGISKASALKADWKGFRGYYRRITQTRITAKDSEEINIERRFYFGYERIQLYLFNILGIYTVNRLYALLSLQFYYLHNPEGGPPILLVEIKSEHINNNFPFPKIINDPSLIFSPYIFIFAFEVPTLSFIERLRKLFVKGGR
ncbi:hypothetical protein N7530_005992 [Penicillium desertorum]|uniref:Uncharacterized protein n=1 Tax=Penicillium desertorum TaxID=1303715 RepID=A0A9W9X120_9EURO|nr:hypothetical protein N7530_005992 [Penicillium desertorum]